MYVIVGIVGILLIFKGGTIIARSRSIAIVSPLWYAGELKTRASLLNHRKISGYMVAESEETSLGVEARDGERVDASVFTTTGLVVALVRRNMISRVLPILKA